MVLAGLSNAGSSLRTATQIENESQPAARGAGRRAGGGADEPLGGVAQWTGAVRRVESSGGAAGGAVRRARRVGARALRGRGFGPGWFCPSGGRPARSGAAGSTRILHFPKSRGPSG